MRQLKRIEYPVSIELKRDFGNVSVDGFNQFLKEIEKFIGESGIDAQTKENMTICHLHLVGVFVIEGDEEVKA